MSDNVKFYAAYTATAESSIHDIWAIWVDVNNWKNWDNGIAHTEIRDSFKVGNKFSLTPQGGEPVEITLKTVTQGEEFSDEAVLPFGTIRNAHRVKAVGKKIQLTHEIHADIDKEAAGFFAKEVWPHMQSGLPEAVNNIISIVQED
jgi:hypothetical protein